LGNLMLVVEVLGFPATVATQQENRREVCDLATSFVFNVVELENVREQLQTNFAGQELAIR